MATTPMLLDAAADGSTKKVKRLIRKGADVNAADSRGWTALHLASHGGHNEVVALLLNAGANVNSRSVNGETALLFAANAGHESVVSTLLENGADKSAADDNGRTPLFVALKGLHSDVVALLSDKEPESASAPKSSRFFGNTGTSNLVANSSQNTSNANQKRLLDRKKQDEQELRDAVQEGDVLGVEELLDLNPEIDVNSVDSQGHTALYLGAAAGRTETVHILLQNGANTESADSIGRTPLWLAADGGYVRMVGLLLEHDANKEARDVEGRTPLFAAAEKGHGEVIKALVKKGAQIETPNSNDETPLYVAAAKGQSAALSALIDLGADVNAVNNKGFTPLHKAAEQSRVPVTTRLLAAGANVEAIDINGATPLFLAAENGQTQIARLLIQANATVNASNKHGETPLYVASVYGHSTVVSVLLDNGADPEVGDTLGDTPLMAACGQGRTTVMSELINAGANLNAANGSGETALHFACREGFQNAVSMLIRGGANIRAGNAESGETGLHMAARDGHVGVIQVLLNASSRNNGTRQVPLHLMTDTEGETALHVATRYAHVHVMQLLIDYDEEMMEEAESDMSLALGMPGDIINFRNRDGLAPLHVAAKQQHRGAVMLLLDNEADVNIADKMGDTPLHIAARLQDSYIVQLLLNEGADENAGNVRGQTPLHVAVETAQPDNVRELLAAGADVNIVDLSHRSPLDLVSSNVTNPTILEMKLMMKVAANSTANSTDISLERSMVTPNAPMANDTRVPALGSEQGKGSSGSGLSSEGLLPILVAIVPLIAIAFVIMAAVFFLTRKRQRRLELEKEVQKRQKDANLQCNAKKVCLSPRYDVVNASQELRSSFDAHAMAPVEFTDPIFVEVAGTAPPEDDASSISNCSTCGWTEVSDDEMEGPGAGMSEIWVDDPGRPMHSNPRVVGRRCSKGSRGRVSRKCSKVRARQLAAQSEALGDSVPGPSHLNSYGQFGVANEVANNMVSRNALTLPERQITYMQSSEDYENMAEMAASLRHMRQQLQARNASMQHASQRDQPVPMCTHLEPSPSWLGPLPPVEFGNWVDPDVCSCGNQGCKVCRRQTAPH